MVSPLTRNSSCIVIGEHPYIFVTYKSVIQLPDPPENTISLIFNGRLTPSFLSIANIFPLLVNPETKVSLVSSDDKSAV